MKPHLKNRPETNAARWHLATGFRQRAKSERLTMKLSERLTAGSGAA
ncbi:hypothetical protein MNBD_DELTA04-1725 [hydrothermal vent metagenome]|uniref:Uncharacterized protein n=1 Tax=hydrothermal vent metagenome TaxID=652676 RepID=A0A3B0WBM5_9ZZZZ